MAVYDIDSLPTKFANGDIVNCYVKNWPNSGEKTITLPRGTFKLECWGATGEPFTPNDFNSNDKGGYATGILTTTGNTTLYLNAGCCKNFGQGGWNGSTNGNNQNFCASGGGATHIATASGQLSALSGNKGSILLVAGGSGGEAYKGSVYKGGTGGGATGGNGNTSNSSYRATGGTQSAGGSKAGSATAGSFGIGGAAYYGGGNIMCGAGGAGWYGGGGGCTVRTGGVIIAQYDACAGGGGSGYVDTGRLTGTSMSNNASSNPDTTRYQGFIRITMQSVSYGIDYSVNYNGRQLFSAHADSDSVAVTYDGTQIASVSSGQTKTLNCGNKLMSSNVIIGAGGGYSPLLWENYGDEYRGGCQLTPEGVN